MATAKTAVAIERITANGSSLSLAQKRLTSSYGSSLPPLGTALHLAGWFLVIVGHAYSGIAALAIGAYLVVGGPLSLTYSWLPMGTLWRWVLRFRTHETHPRVSPNVAHSPPIATRDTEKK